MVSVSHVELGKVLCLAESVQQFADEGKWVAVLGRDVVQTSVVNAEMAKYRIGPDLGWFPIRSELFKRDSGPINSELGANPVRSGSELHQQNSNSSPVTHI